MSGNGRPKVCKIRPLVVQTERRAEGRAELVSMDKGRGPGKGVGGREILPRSIETGGCP